MGHDIHFLSRLERISLEHAELALTLYRDAELLEYIMTAARIPDGAERVAISLDDPQKGPFLIVARNGHFVTCLGKDMSVGDLPVIPRTQLDGLSSRVAELRRRIEMALELTGGEKSEVTRLLARVNDAGDRMTREEFIAIAAWQPLLRQEFLRALFRAATQVQDYRIAFGRVDRFRPRPKDEPLLRAFWNTLHSIGHLVVLTAIDDGREVIESLPPELDDIRHELSWGPVRQGIVSLALRGGWAVGKLGKPMLPGYKQLHQENRSPTKLIDTSLGLMAIASRHSRLFAEVRKAIAPSAAQISASLEAMRQTEPSALTMPQKASSALRQIAGIVLDAFNEHPEPMLALEYERAARLFCLYVEKVPKAASLGIHEPEDVPEHLAIAAMANCPGDFLNHTEMLSWMMNSMPWIARAKAEELYFPRDVVDALFDRWQPEYAVKHLAIHQQYYGAKRPVRTAPKPGRNQSCSCGSGHKYKHCCGK